MVVVASQLASVPQRLTLPRAVVSLCVYSGNDRHHLLRVRGLHPRLCPLLPLLRGSADNGRGGQRVLVVRRREAETEERKAAQHAGSVLLCGPTNAQARGCAVLGERPDEAIMRSGTELACWNTPRERAPLYLS